MIKEPIAIVGVLLAVEIFILFLSTHKKTQHYFSFLPAVFWIYFLPMVLSTFGIIDSKSPIYQKISFYLLPASLFILLMTVDLKAILRLGAVAISMFIIGSLGIVLGAPIVFFIFQPWIGPEFWSGFGALAGSWTGGSANMIAVKEAISTPEYIFLPMVVVDTVVPYVWMGLIVAFVCFQNKFDQWNHSNCDLIDQMAKKQKAEGQTIYKWDLKFVLLIVGLGLAASLLTQFLGSKLPVIKDVISPFTWTIVLVTTIALILSISPLHNLDKYNSQRIGYFLLYFVLTTIGAKASLAQLDTALILILAGFCLAIIHGIFLIFGARILKAPMFLMAAASQANLGGVASAPVVAEIYQPGLASVGLLMAILGNIIGTYLGIIAAQLCHLIAY